MKYTTTPLAVGLALALTSGAFAQLTIVDSMPGAFVDISGTGTALNLSDDGETDIPTTVGNSELGAGTVRVGSNGAARFGGPGLDLAFTNAAIPSATAFSLDSQVLMPYWDDVNTVSGVNGNIYWQEIAGVLYIQWDNVDYFGGGVDTATWQLQVFAAGPALAQFIYTDIEDAVGHAGGESATIGYQSGGFAGGDVQWSFDTPGSVGNGTVLSLIDGGGPCGSMIPGDNCADALAIAGLGIFPFDTTGAQCPSDPAWPCALGDNDVWFRWTADFTGVAEVNTCTGATGYDSCLEIFDGGDCGALNSVQCNDDSCGLQSRVSASVVAGSEYLVRVGGFNGAQGTGELEILDVTPPPPGPGCFSDRGSWNALAGATTSIEDFEGFVMDTSFEPGPVPISVGTIEVNSGGVGFRNAIDVAPFMFTDNNGTNHASCFTNFDEPTTIKITFTSPVFAYGADLTGATSGEMAETAIYGCGGTLLAVCATASNDVDQFSGYAANQLIECVVFQSVTLTPGGGGEGFTADNISCVDVDLGPGVACNGQDPNTTGQVGQIYGTGSASVSANDLELHCACLTPGEFGGVIASDDNQIRSTPRATNNLCVATSNVAMLGRYGLNDTGDLGVLKQIIDVDSVPIAGVGGAPPFTRALMAGDTWYFQCWHREPAPAISSFSEAICITFTP